MDGLKRLSTKFLISLVYALPVSAGTLNLSDLPLTVGGNADPNVVLTLDDTISMQNGYVPKELNGLPIKQTQRKKYYRSAAVNSLFYNPELTYLPPNKADGSRELPAEFDEAIRGFYHTNDSSQRVIDLRGVLPGTGFLAVRSHRWNKNPKFINGCSDFDCSAQAAHYYVFNAGLFGCSGSTADDACFQRVVVTTNSGPSRVRPEKGDVQSSDERQNFANWYQYYATRMDAAKSALRNAMIPANVSSSVRLARQNMHWTQSANSPTVHSGPINGIVNEIAVLDEEERKHLYDWISNTPMELNTPIADTMLRAGEFFGKPSSYQLVPSSTSLQSPALSCRTNTHIVVTDGFQFKNDAVSLPAAFHKDENPVTLPDGRRYIPGDNPIYSSSENIISKLSITNNYSLSDLAFHYWATDLLGGSSDNNVVPFFADTSGTEEEDYWNPVNDPATWQHVNTYVLTFGLGGTLPETERTYQELLNGSINWPAPEEGQATSVDDMYHATINGRGGFFNANNSDELVSAIQSIFSRVSASQSAVDTVSANSGRIGGDSLVYVAGYDTASRSGRLQAFNFSDGSEFGEANASGCNANALGTVCSGVVWDAAQQNPSAGTGSVDHTNRKIYTYQKTPAAPSGQGINFTWGELNTDQRQLLEPNGDGLSLARVNYLRGDSSNEVAQGGVFRTRTGIDDGPATQVGAIVHSNPVYVGNGVDANGFKEYAIPDDLESKSYHSFLRSNTVSRRSEMVYVGANDGMLHGYRAGRTNGGKEVFAYVPDIVIENLPAYSNPSAGYRAYIDGAVTTQDAYFNGGWRSMLVAGLRTGGQGIYALDITNPTADAKAIAHWEFSDRNDADMGYSYGKPLIVKSNYKDGGEDGEWVVIVPNGYNSTELDGRSSSSGEAVLYVLALDDGEILAKLNVPGGTTTNPSGLSSPVAVSDSDIKHFSETASGTDPDNYSADYVYAGDLQGKMWKFDLSSTDKDQWHAVLLFDAGSDQPITGKPSVGSALRTGTGDNKKYRYVYFGTGKYIENSDRANADIQAFYGLIDTDDTACSTSTACISNNSLLLQSIDANGVASDNSPLTASNKGWKLNLSAGTGSERVIGRIAVIGDVVFFVSLQPSGTVCGSSGTSSLYALNRFNGGQTRRQVLDIDNSYTLNGEVVSKKDIPFTTDMNIYGGLSGNKLGIVTGGESGSKKPNESGFGVTGGEDLSREGRVRWRQLK